MSLPVNSSSSWILDGDYICSRMSSGRSSPMNKSRYKFRTRIPVLASPSFRLCVILSSKIDILWLSTDLFSYMQQLWHPQISGLRDNQKIWFNSGERFGSRLLIINLWMSTWTTLRQHEESGILDHGCSHRNADYHVLCCFHFIWKIWAGDSDSEFEFHFQNLRVRLSLKSPT